MMTGQVDSTLENVTFDKPILLEDVIVDPKSIEFYTKIIKNNSKKATFNSAKKNEKVQHSNNKSISNSHMKIKVSEIATKIISTDGEHLSFAIKMLVENNSNKKKLFFSLQGLDNDGFVFYEIEFDAVIPVGESIVLTAKEDYVEKEVFNQIKEWKVKESTRGY